MQEENDHITEEEIRSILRAAGLTALSQLNQLSPAQQEELENWLQQHPRHLQWWTELTRTGQLSELSARYQSLESMAVTELEKFDQAYLAQPTPVRRMSILRRWGWVAASIVLLLGIGTYFWQADKKSTLPALISEISPGSDGAILTLSNGKQVVLDSLQNGLVAVQKGAQAVIRNGELVYDASGAAAGEVTYNTMRTPKGRQFRLQLPDGSRVWLNAASSIRYPTAFTGAERKVEITGEAYFEVAKAYTAGGSDGVIPFRVNISNRAEVEVLGTHFNINAYDNESSIHTTLMEGSIRVMQNSKGLILKPGQQAIIAATGSIAMQLIEQADTDKVMAWKNGLFYFEGLTLEEAMRQLERWYNIEVVYEGKVPAIQFGGKMSRDLSLSGLLQLLSDSQLKFRLEEGRRLIVLQ